MGVYYENRLTHQKIQPRALDDLGHKRPKDDAEDLKSLPKILPVVHPLRTPKNVHIISLRPPTISKIRI